MADYAFRIVNVFAEAPLAGNPLAVFEDGRGLDDTTMQALALQFNLSETTFILPSAQGSARVRIFTPTFEMPFAGHPTLGSAHVVRAIGRARDQVTLEMKAGLIPVSAIGDEWTLEAKPPRTRSVAAPRATLAKMLGLNDDAIAAEPLWVDTGSEQLVIPLASADAVRNCAPDAALLVRHASVGIPGAVSSEPGPASAASGVRAPANQRWPSTRARRPSIAVKGGGERAMAYVWAYDQPGSVRARFFFPKHGAIVEDPGTGSACANLGGWLVATHAPRPLSLIVLQGEAVGRPCRLGLAVDAAERIFVSGRVIELGRGIVSL